MRSWRAGALTSTHSTMRPGALATAVLAASVAAGCGYADHGLGPPDITIGPVAPLQIELTGPSDRDVFVDWTGYHAHFTLTRAGQEIATDPGCEPRCGEGCACAGCDGALPIARRIRSGQTISFEWEPVRYAARSCDTDAGCTCVEVWPLTAGTYDIAFLSYASATGGAPSDADADILVGATIDSSSPDCQAETSFSLAPSVLIEARLSCGP